VESAIWPQHVKRVIVIPMSGYVNRLQAIASSSIIADQCDADFFVCWTNINVTPAPATDVFSAEFVERHVIEPTQFRELTGIEPGDVSPYMTVSHSLVTLAGSDMGEQFFMPQLRARLEQSQEPVNLVFSAGGNFSFSNPETAIDQRENWYRKFDFADAIESRVKQLLRNRGPFIGVHLRYTDRSHEAPLKKEIDQAILHQVESLSTDSIFIASDTNKERDRLFKKLEKAGLKPWTADLDLSNAPRSEAAVGALIDWKVLGNAQSSVSFAASSFGHEAAVMAGSIHTSSALAGHPIQRIRSRAKELKSNLVNYPRNHWFH
jgi:hypothetical protein